LVELKKRTYQTFLGQIEDEIGINGTPNPIHDDIIKAKFELKYNNQYKDVGALKPPGVLVDDVKRRKILEELGVAPIPLATAPKKVVEEEEKKAQVPPSLMTEELVK
jgi:hypothetical protein